MAENYKDQVKPSLFAKSFTSETPMELTELKAPWKNLVSGGM